MRRNYPALLTYTPPPPNRIPDMEELERLCAVCAKPLPKMATARARYCSKHCRDKATYRRAKNQPIADPTATAEEIAQLRANLAQQQNANVQLQKTVAKLQNQIATAQRRADRNHAKNATLTAHLQAEKQLHSENVQHANERLQQQNLQLHFSIECLKDELAQVRAKPVATETELQLRKEVADVEKFTVELVQLYRSLYQRFLTVSNNYVLTANDFLAAVTWVANNKPEHKLTPQDYDRFTRAKRLRRNMPQAPRQKNAPLPTRPDRKS